jgi:hypothetical protein
VLLARGAAVPAAARRAEGEELARRFFDAAAGGDLDALLTMLAPDVVFLGDGTVQAIRSVVNPDKLGHLGPVSDVARIPGRE